MKINHLTRIIRVVKMSFLVVFFCLPKAKTQDISWTTLSTCGDVYEAQGGQWVSWSLGQVAQFVDLPSGHHIYPGFQQGGLQVLSSDEIIENTIELEVYPNPVGEQLNIVIKGSDVEGPLEFRLLGPDGRVYDRGKLSEGKDILPMRSFPPGVYILGVFQEHKLLNNIKILKL